MSYGRVVRQTFTALSSLAALIGLLACVGCGDPNVPRGMVPVSGKISLDGQPLAKGMVRFFAVDRQAVRVMPQGSLDGSGNYQMTTAGSPGAPLGKYKVCVSEDRDEADARMKAGSKAGSPIPVKYSEPDNTPLEVEVVGSPAAGAYDLILSSK